MRESGKNEKKTKFRGETDVSKESFKHTKTKLAQKAFHNFSHEVEGCLRSSSRIKFREKK